MIICISCWFCSYFYWYLFNMLFTCLSHTLLKCIMFNFEVKHSQSAFEEMDASASITPYWNRLPWSLPWVKQLLEKFSSFYKKLFVIAYMSLNITSPGTMVAYTILSCWKKLFLGPWILNTSFLYSSVCTSLSPWSLVNVSPLKET